MTQYTTPKNPWGLTQHEVSTLEAMAKTGESKLAARLRGVNQGTVNVQMRHAAEKMQARNPVLALLTWDRMRRAA